MAGDRVFHYKHGWIKVDGPVPGNRSADKLAAKALGHKTGADLNKMKAHAQKMGPHSKAAADYKQALADTRASAAKLGPHSKAAAELARHEAAGGGAKKASLDSIGKSLPGKGSSSPPGNRSADKIAARALGKDTAQATPKLDVKPVKTKPSVTTAAHKKSSLEGLSSSQLGALELYSGDDYKGINGGLRTGKVTAKYKPTVAAIDSALAAKPLAQPTKVWRTVGGNAFGLSHGSDASSLKGKVFTEAGFMSTSTTNQRFPVKPPPVHITVEVPAGVGAAYLEPITKNVTENELLLPRNLRYVVTNVRYSSAKGGWTATARVLPAAGVS